MCSIRLVNRRQKANETSKIHVQASAIYGGLIVRFRRECAARLYNIECLKR